MYAAPSAAYGNDPYRARTEISGTPIKKSLRIVYLVAAIIGAIGFFSSIGTWTAAMIAVDTRGRPDESLLVAGIVSFTLCILAVYVAIFVGVGWVYRTWSWLPETERHTKHWRSATPITPGTAALFLLIPYFQYYWMFVVNCGLCDAMDRLRVARPTTSAAPKNLAIAACILQMIVPMPVGVLLWYLFMSRIERMSEEMAAQPMPGMPR